MFLASIRRNRARSGKFAKGCRLIADGGYWIGPGLGDFRNAAEARQWASRNGYKVQ